MTATQSIATSAQPTGATGLNDLKTMLFGAPAPESLTDKLDREGNARRGTELGGLLQWAKLHIEGLTETLRERDAELATAIGRLRPMEAELNHLCSVTDEMHSRILKALPMNPFATLAHDRSSFANCMVAHGVQPYAKAKRKPKEVRGEQ